MKKFMVLGVMGLAVCVLACFQFLSPSRDAEVPEKGKIPGAYRALVAWNAARSHGEQPPGAMSDAFDRVKHRFPKANRVLKLKKAATWRSLGPNSWSGRTLALAIHPINTNRMYAGSASGGLWRSETGGQGLNAWEQVATGFPTPGVSAIAIPANQPDVIYIGTGEVYQYQEAELGIGERISRGSYGIGVLKSEDGGATWKPSLDWRLHQERGVMDIEVDPTDNNVVWAATTEGVYKSEDAGASWTRSLDVIMATSLIINPNQPNRVMAACGGFSSEGHGLYLTRDGGDGWEKITAGLPATFNGKAMLDISQSNPDIVYASIANGWSLFFGNATWLCRSEDGGETFTIVNTQDYAAWQGWYSHYVSIHPQNPDLVYLGGINLSISSDGGKTIQPISNFFADHHAQIFVPGDPSKLYVAADQGVGLYDAQTNIMGAANHGLRTIQFYNGMANSLTQRNLIFGGPQDYARGFRYNNQGWSQIQAGREGGYNLIDPNNNNITYHGGSDNTTFHRFGLPGQPASIPPCENGNSCVTEELFDITAFNPPLVLAPSNTNVLYAARQAVYRSDDQATSWQATHGGQPLDGNSILSMGISHTDDGVLYAGTAPGSARMGIFRTRDGGATWDNITGNLPDRHPTDLIVDPSDDRIVYLTLSGFGSSHLFRTKDGGETWEDLDRGNLPDVPTNAFLLDSQAPGHLYVGNDLGVFATIDDGASWFSFNDGLPETVIAMDLLMYPPSRLLRVGTYGNGLYQTEMLPVDAAPVEGAGQRQYVLPELGDGDLDSVIGVVNGGSSQVSFQINGFNAAGELVDGLERSLPANGRLYQSVTALFGDQADAVSWVSVTGDQPLAVFAEIQGPGLRSAYPAAVPGRQNWLPHVARDTGQFKTVLSAVNATAGTAEARLIQYPLSTSSEVSGLSPWTRNSDLIQNWFGDDLSGVQWAALRSDRTPIGAMEYFTRLPQEQEMAALALESDASDHLRFLHIAKDTGLFWTGVVYINVGDTATTVQETYYGDDGSVLGQAEVDVAAGGKETLLFDYLTVQDPNSRFFPNSSWMEVKGDQPLVGYELFGAPVTIENDTFAGLQSNQESGTRILYPHVQSTETQWTGLVAVNTSEFLDDLHLTLYNENGEALSTTTLLAIAPKAKVTRLVRDLFPEQAEQGAWVEARSRLGHAWSGFLLWGDQGGNVRHHMSGMKAEVR